MHLLRQSSVFILFLLQLNVIQGQTKDSICSVPISEAIVSYDDPKSIPKNTISCISDKPFVGCSECNCRSKNMDFVQCWSSPCPVWALSCEEETESSEKAQDKNKDKGRDNDNDRNKSRDNDKDSGKTTTKEKDEDATPSDSSRRSPNLRESDQDPNGSPRQSPDAEKPIVNKIYGNRTPNYVWALLIFGGIFAFCALIACCYCLIMRCKTEAEYEVEDYVSRGPTVHTGTQLEATETSNYENPALAYPYDRSQSVAL